MDTFSGDEARAFLSALQKSSGTLYTQESNQEGKPKGKQSGDEAAKQVLKGNWFLRIFAGREVMNAGKALDAYDEEGWNGYLYTSVENAHREIGFDFSNGQYINPWARAAPKKLKSFALGEAIGWGENQTPGAVQQTMNVTAKLTRSTISKWAKQGLTKEWVTEQLRMYTNSQVAGKMKLNNKQLPARIELMEKILKLWK